MSLICRIFKNGTNELIYKAEIVTDVKKKQQQHWSWLSVTGGKGEEEG